MPNTDLISQVVSSESFKELERLNSLLDTTVNKFVDALASAKAFDAGITGSGSLKDFKDATKAAFDEQQKLNKVSADIIAIQEKRVIAESKLAQTLAQEKILLQQTNKENANRAKIALTEAGSLSRLEAVRVKLLASQKALNLTTEEGQRKNALYIKSLDRISESIKAGSAAAERQRMNVGNYQGSAKIIVDAMERARVKVVQLEQEFGKMGPEAQQARKEFETLRKVTENGQFLNISAKVGDTNKELRYFTKELNRLEDAGLKNTKVYKDIQTRLAQLTDQLGDTRAEIKALSSDSRSFDLFAGSVSFAADAFQTAAGAAVLFGASEEDAAKATRTLIAVQSVANGVKSIATEITTKGTAANKVYAAVQGVVATATNATATATERLVAVGKLLLGVGLVYLVYKLAEGMGLFSGEISNAEKAMNKLNDAQVEGAKNAAIELNNLKKTYEAAIDKTKGIDSQRKAAIELQKTYPETFGNFTLEQIYLGKAKTGYENLAKSILAASIVKAKQSLIDQSAMEFAEKDEKLRQEIEKKRKQIAEAPALEIKTVNLNRFKGDRGTKTVLSGEANILNTELKFLIDEKAKLNSDFENQNKAFSESIAKDQENTKIAEANAAKKIENDNKVLVSKVNNSKKSNENYKNELEDLKAFKDASDAIIAAEGEAGRTIDELQAEKAIKAFERVRDNESIIFSSRLIAGKLATQARIEQITKVADYEVKEAEGNLQKQIAIQIKLANDIDDINYDADEKEKAILKGVADFKKEQDQKEIESAEKKKQELIKKEQETADKTKELKRQLLTEVENTLAAIIDAGFARQKQRLDQEAILLDKNKDKELDRINKLAISEEEKAAKIKILDANIQAGKESIARRQRQVDIEKARFDKQKAIFDIGIATAVAIVKVIPNPVLIALVSAIGALQLAAVIARPIPQFKTGKRKGQSVNGGIAMVDDGGVAEVIEKSDGSIEVGTNKPRLTYLNDSDTVHTSIDAFIASMKNKNGIGNENKDTQFIKWQIENANLQTERMIEAYKNSPKAVVNISPFGIEVLEKTSKGWNNYIDKMVRHKK